MLESGKYATIAEMAAAEKINESYVGRVLRLTLLAPNTVEAILLQFDWLVRRFPVEWRTSGYISRLRPIVRPSRNPAPPSLRSI
jgi:hypothetical protein